MFSQESKGQSELGSIEILYTRKLGFLGQALLLKYHEYFYIAN